MQCPTCQDEMRQIPAGVSKKTGKPYRAFWACDKQACKDAKAQNRTNTPFQTQNAPTPQFNPDYKALEEKVATLEMALANMRVWASKVEKRLSGVETIVEGMQMNKAALPLHQSFAPHDVHEIKTPEAAAAIVDSYKSDPTIPTINGVPEGFDK